MTRSARFAQAIVDRRPGLLALVLAALLVPSLHGPARAQAPQSPLEPSTLTVNGRGEVMADPDQAIIRLGAQAQAQTAAEAQGQVNAVVARLVEALRQMGLPERFMQTSTLLLTPVYRHDLARIRAGALEPEESEPQIVGYRSTTTVQVTLDDLAWVAPVVDASIAAGGNRIEGISFQLRDDRRQREQALRRAVAEAEAKALVLADAAGARLTGLARVEEGGIGIVRPMMEHARLAVADGAVVQPGQVTVEATVTMHYRIRVGRGPGR